jgi:DNA-binding transcriptional MerR regulator
MVLTITDLAAELGVRSDTLRYYERSGLIPSAGRTPGGYRLYGSEVADRVRFIKSAQRSGLRLRDIEELLAIMDDGNCPCGHTADLVERRLSRGRRRDPPPRSSAIQSRPMTTRPVEPFPSKPGPV